MSDTAEYDLARTALRACGVADANMALHPLTGGASRVSFRAISDSDDLVVQVARDQSEADMATEAAVIRSAEAVGVPVPELVGHHVVDGRHVLISRWVTGDTVPRRVMRALTPDGTVQLIADVGRAAARLHTVQELPSGVERCDLLTTYTERLHESTWTRPVLEAASRVLEERRPVAAPSTLVHGDLRLGNWIISDHHLRAVVDWELAHWGDPYADLAWMMITPWRFGGSLPVAGVATVELLLEEYAAAGGIPPAHDVLQWHCAVGVFVWAVMCIGQCEAHLSGARRSHELAVIGRRVTENEAELVSWMRGT